MNRLAWISIVVLAGITSLVVGDLLDPDPVPIARAVELTGTVPTDRPAPEGFFVVPPRVVDFRDDQEESDDDDSSDSTESSLPENAVADRPQSPDDSDGDGDQDDDGSDDSPDELDDEDDSVDDDD